MMNFKKYMALILAATALLAGCKDEEETTPTLSGSVTFDYLPAYVKMGDSFEISVSGVYKGNGKSASDSLVGYRVYDPIRAVYDTLRHENENVPATGTFTISKDTTGTFTLSVYAFAKGYYGASQTCTFTVVNPSLDTLKGSITGHPLGYDATTSFVDARDLSLYYASSLSTGGWMLQNLAWSGAGYPFYDCEAMSYISGRYYNWDEAMIACPEGWKLPSDADFVALAGSGAAGETISGAAGRLKCDASFNGVHLWTYQNYRITLTNETLFTALPWGYLTVSAGAHSFTSPGESAVFWTCDQHDADTAFARYIKLESNDILVQAMDKKSFYASVRCIKK